MAVSVPNGSGNECINLNDLFPGIDQASLDVATGVYGSDANMNQLWTQHQEEHGIRAWRSG